MSVLEALFPSWAARRETARATLVALRAARTYAGAEITRLTKDWLSPSTSADAEIITDLDALRNRSRQLNRDDPHASAATSTRVAHVVGDRVRIQAKCQADESPLPPYLVGRKINEEQAETANRHAEWAFGMIAEDMDGAGMSLAELLALTERQVCESGEAILRLINVQRRDVPLTVAVEMIEPDRLFTPPDRKTDPNIRGGVEYQQGIPVAYWISQDHPGDTFRRFRANDFDRYPADLIMHEYDMLRPGQSRGQPWFASVMVYLRHKGMYQEAELVAQRMSACLALLVTTNNPASVVAQQGVIQSDATRHETFRPGEVKYFSPNQTVAQVNPLRPGDNYVPSMHEILRAIGTALNIPYVILAQDYESVNYSSMRAAIVQMQRYIAIRRARKTTRTIRRLWSAFYDEAVLAGMISAPRYSLRRSDYQRFRVQWPASQWVDPEKEVKADVLAVNSGLVPLEFISAKYEADAQEIIAQVAREEVMRKDSGLPTLAEQNAKAKSPSDERPNDEKEGKDGETDAGKSMHDGNGFAGRMGMISR